MKPFGYFSNVYDDCYKANGDCLKNVYIAEILICSQISVHLKTKHDFSSKGVKKILS